MTINDKIKQGFVILDGAMGTVLQAKGLKLGERPEVLNIEKANLLVDIHKAYIKAGSDVIYTNTFGANRLKLAKCDYDVKAIVDAGVKNAKKAVLGTNTLVALDIGPLGELLEPLGTLTFEEAYEIFKEIVLVGKNAGADLVVIETMTDLYEVKAAILAVKENSDLPVIVTMTFEENGRTFTGCSMEAMATTLEGLRVDALGINCSFGPKEILNLAEKLSELTNLPLIVKPNAGLPNPKDGKYDVGAKEFGSYIKDFAKAGVRIFGGCCGTTPEYIENIKSELKKCELVKKDVQKIPRVASGSNAIHIDELRVVGERINPTGKPRFKQAVLESDMNYILKQALEQIEAGAEILDVNVGVPNTDEKTNLCKIVKALQSVVDVPLQLDSSKIGALEAALRIYNGKPIINSVSCEQEKMDELFPIVKKYGACVIGLTIDEDGIPETSEKRFEIAKRIVEEAEKYGIPSEDIIIDCLALTVSAQQDAAIKTLDAMRKIKTELGVGLTLGISNISFGLPNRTLINSTFLISAATCGLTLAIMNSNSKPMMDAINAFRVLSAKDKDSAKFISSYSNQKEESKKEIKKIDEGLTIEEAIFKGLEKEVYLITNELLKIHTPIELIDKRFIPCLDEVGRKYETNEFFLPQLIKSAQAACLGFEIIKEKIKKKGESNLNRGTIIVATVKGDVHDIGKNIVKVILENYGYKIIDLGKDVSAEKIIEIAKTEKVGLIGLSALMTTTVESMKDTIEAIRNAGITAKIVVGGAVLTAQYASEIEADFYANDANEVVSIAKEVFIDGKDK
jgi:5-methyltetrahydrofolate--homocysteine methyltransferase